MNCVLYTGTHDLDPIAGWWAVAPAPVRRRALEAMKEAGIEDEPAWGLVRLALSSRASLAIVQAQEVLELGSEARFNTPGTTGGNWSWRLEPGELTPELARKLHDATARAARLKIGSHLAEDG